MKIPHPACEKVSDPSGGSAFLDLNLEDIATVLLAAGIGIGESAPHHAHLVVTIYRELAKGSPIAAGDLEALARASGVPMDLASSAAARWLELGPAGELVGFGGLTLRPTKHRLVLNGALTLYLWCALDGFLIAHALGQPVRIVTCCPTSGMPIVVAATATHVEEVAPKTSVMSIIAPESNAACNVTDTRRGFCDFVNFYQSEETALTSMRGRGGAVLTMDRAFSLAGLLTIPLANARP